MMLPIKHFSQYSLDIPESQQKQACGICCVKMVLDFLCPDNNHIIEDLFQEATLIKAFDQNINGGLWTHEGLVRILRNHNATAYPQEFKSVLVDLKNKTFNENNNQVKFVQNGIDKIKIKLENKKPVVVSVTAGFNQNNDDHMIIINGYDKSSKEVFYISDPQDKNFEVVHLETFLKHWKKLAIFVD